jgi:hypothetical protein
MNGDQMGFCVGPKDTKACMGVDKSLNAWAGYQKTTP